MTGKLASTSPLPPFTVEGGVLLHFELEMLDVLELCSLRVGEGI